jgi:hypothetical protein
MYELDPSLKAMHVMTADGPEECRHLMQQNFSEDTFDCNATIPSYTAWYRGNDMRATYRRHRDLLKLIGSTQPERRWVLKYPVHMRKLRSLLEIYPDACIVQTHRDALQVIPSYCSMMESIMMIRESVDRTALGPTVLEYLARSLERGLRARETLDPSRIFDVDYHRFIADPEPVVRDLYTYFGFELPPETVEAMRRHAEGHRKDRHGKHEYSLQMYGLNEAAVRDRLAAYIDRFGLPAG